MIIVDVEMIYDFAKNHADARRSLAKWIQETKEADWQSPDDIKAAYLSASILSDHRVVFNIKGNNYRLLVHVNYRRKLVSVLQLGTHAEYSKWNL